MNTNILIFYIVIISLLSISLCKDAIVVGSGVSGLNAASLLKDKGFNVKILEARTRPGGRLHSDKSFGYALDLGAAWIHGNVNNSVYDLAKQKNINLLKFDYEDMEIYSTTLQPSDLTGADHKMSELGKNFWGYVNENIKTLKSDVSLKQIYDSYLKETPLNNVNTTLFNNYMAIEIENDYGSKIENLSTMSLDLIKTTKGTDFLIPDGYLSIFESLVSKNEIIYNAEVMEIQSGTDTITVKTRDGKQYMADYVVVTVPLGVLKANTIKFTPNLSSEKQAAISKLNFGCLEKVIIEFTENFWDDVNLIKILNTPVSPFNWLVNFEKLAGKNTLIFLIGGENKYIDFYNLSKSQIEQAVVDQLKKIYPSKNIQVSKSIITNWKNDPYARGAYTSYGVGSNKANVNSFLWVEGKIVFAGEHTNFDDLQTVKGAYLSGQRAVDQIMKMEAGLDPNPLFGDMLKFNVILAIFLLAFIM
jgi:monoamine oxidase